MQLWRLLLIGSLCLCLPSVSSAASRTAGNFLPTKDTVVLVETDKDTGKADEEAAEDEVEPVPKVEAQKIKEKKASENDEFEESEEAVKVEEGTEGEEGLERAEGSKGVEGEEGEEGEEEEEVGPRSLTAALFLLGGVTFVMSLFYLVNHPDEDIKRHSWEVISATISIFVAVLLFQGMNGVVNMWTESLFGHVSEHAVTSSTIGVSYLQFIVFYGAMCTILSTYAFLPMNADENDFEFRRKLKMVCWATLFAHMSGFALIRCILEVQQLPMFGEGAAVFLPTLFNGFLLFLLFKVADRFRGQYAAPGSENKVGIELYHEQAKEAENDVASIALSFCLVVVVRFLSGGELANAEGLELPLVDHPMSAKTIVGVGTLLCTMGGLSINIVYSKVAKKCCGVDPHHSYLSRWMDIISTTMLTMSSWLSMFFVKWVLHSYMLRSDPDNNPNSCINRVLLALIVSFSSFLLVTVLDYIKDLDATGDATDHAIIQIIQAVGVCVGFSWEQSFDAGVEVIGELTADHGNHAPVYARLGLAILIAIIMTPAWRKYILKKVLELEEQHSKKNDATSS